MSVNFGDSNINAEIETPSLSADISRPSISINFNAPTLGAKGGGTLLRGLVNPQFFIGTVETLQPGEDVYCYLTGTKDAPVLNFGIPMGYTGDQGPAGQDGADGQDGQDGAAATIAVGTVTTGLPTDPASVTNTGTSASAVFDFVIPKGDKGDTGATGADGADGTDGADGVSPAVTISAITGGHNVTITDADHPAGQSFNVMDGIDGTDGQDGQNGVGVPSGGTAGQVLTKSSSTDYDTEWALPFSMKLLWTNSKPTSDFAAQTLAIDVSDYDFIAVEHKVYSSLDQRRIDYGAVGSQFGLIHPASGGGYFSSASNQAGIRGCDTSTPTQVTFGNAFNSTAGGQFGTSNNRCVPYRIYGIKCL